MPVPSPVSKIFGVIVCKQVTLVCMLSVIDTLREAPFLKELYHDILNHFFDGLNYSWSVAKPKNNGLLRKKNTKGVCLKQKGTMMAEDGEDWNGLKMMILPG